MPDTDTGRLWRNTLQHRFQGNGAMAGHAVGNLLLAGLSEKAGGMQAALDVATSIGIVTVSNTEFLGDEWEIEGRDYRGRWMQVDVDARTGEVRNVDRSW